MVMWQLNLTAVQAGHLWNYWADELGHWADDLDDYPLSLLVFNTNFTDISKIIWNKNIS